MENHYIKYPAGFNTLDYKHFFIFNVFIKKYFDSVYFSPKLFNQKQRLITSLRFFIVACLLIISRNFPMIKFSFRLGHRFLVKNLCDLGLQEICCLQKVCDSLLCTKLFVHVNHQSQNEYVLHNAFTFYQS